MNLIYQYAYAVCTTVRRFAASVALVGVIISAAAADDMTLPRLDPLPPEEAIESFRLHPDFRIELAAAEPLVRDPIALEFDEDGRAYVIELLPYNQYAKPESRLRGRIVRLEDTTGDGKFDRSEVYCDELDYPTGLACYDGGLFVGDAPNLLYLKDTDGDGRADHREVLYTGFGTDPAGEGQLNSFRWGLDNRIYVSTGLDGGMVRAAGDVAGQPQSVRNRGFAFDPRSRRFELTSGGGQYGMSFDDWGRTFVCDNSDPAKLLLYDDRYTSRNPWMTPPAPAISIAPDGKYTKVMRISPVDPWRVERTRMRTEGKFAGSDEGGTPSGFFTAGTGVTIYRGDAWPAEFRGSLLVGEAANNLVYRARLEPNGVGLTAHRADPEAEFLASTDTWFRPVQFAHGPDGALYVVDMYRELIEGAAFLPPEVLKQMDPLAGSDLGRIYRVAPKGRPWKAQQSMSRLSAAELVPLLESPNGWTRDAAARLLYQQQDKTCASSLRSMASESTVAVGRLHALYALHGLSELRETDVLRALNDDHPRLRAHAVKLAENFASAMAVQEKLAALVNDPEVGVRFQLAFTAGYLPLPQRVPLLAALLRSDGESSWFQAAAQSSLADGAAEMLAHLLEEESTPGAGFPQNFIEALARQIGVAGRTAEIEAVVNLADTIADRPSGASPAAAALVKGLLASRNDAAAKIIATASRGPASELYGNLMKEALEAALNPDLSEESRLEAIATLAAADDSQVEDAFEELLTAQQPPAIQKGALAVLGLRSDSAAAELILDRWAAFTPEVRATGVELLLSRTAWANQLLDAVAAQRVAPSDVDPGRVALLKSHSDPELRQRASKLFQTEANAHRAEVVASYRPALDLEGDVERGRQAFRKACAACHQLEGVGAVIGADLHAIRDRGREAVLLNILDPNREVKPQFQSYAVQTADGRTLGGMIKEETSNSVTLRQADGTDVTVPRVDVDEMLGTGLSFMPEGLERELDHQTMADLLAYLMTVD